MSNYLGVELGSTRIKAVAVDENFVPVRSSEFGWESDFIDGVWTYSMDTLWQGFKSVTSAFGDMELDCVGISGMMHGYLAFDEDWNLLVPFRTWQNTITAQAAEELTSLFNFNVPQRWSIAHLYQAILNGEAHLPKLAHITTLAGYVHYMLTGVNAVGIGEASGIFPIDSGSNDYDAAMVEAFDRRAAEKGFGKKLLDVLPRVLVAGEKAGELTGAGAALCGGMLKPGTAFAPCEGDGGTGMVATNAVAQRTGNVSAGTSIFAMVVLEKALSRVYPEIDMVTTPDGKPVAMVHCNNCSRDMNAWAALFREVAELFGASPDTGELFTKLYLKSLEGEADCSDITIFNYVAGEGITWMDSGKPLLVREPTSRFNLANFMRSQLYSSMATMRLGMDILNGEGVLIDSLTGHGGLFKTPGVAQRYMAAACNTSVTCMESAGEGGPYGMALLAAYVCHSSESLDAFLSERVFSSARSVTLEALEEDVQGFNKYLARYTRALAVEKAAVGAL